MKKTFVTSILVLMVILINIFPASAQSTFKNQDDSTQISNAILEYETLINSDANIEMKSLSSQVFSLIQERKDFYREFFELGLHSDLISMKSDFIDDSLNVLQTTSAGKIELNILEKITFSGKYIAKSETDSPIIQAGIWAVDHANNKVVAFYLNQYVNEQKQALKQSMENGFTTEFIIQHKIVLSKSDGPYIIEEDNFSDKAVDNIEGFDTVVWEAGTFIRNKPDWEKLPNYQMYMFSVEELGKILLQDFESSYLKQGLVAPLAASASYNRTSARNYIDQYTSNTTLTGTCSGVSVRKNNSIWNSLYTKYDCDCANYVSQALKQGLLPTDSIWKKDTYAWRITSDTGANKGLLQWITSKGYAAKQTTIYSLTNGDIAYTTGNGHVVMVTYTYPYLYSGHTNDRKDYGWSSTLTEYYKITY